LGQHNFIEFYNFWGTFIWRVHNLFFGKRKGFVLVNLPGFLEYKGGENPKGWNNGVYLASLAFYGF